MRRIRLSRQERRFLNAWMADRSWFRQKRYEEDQEYLDCVSDILRHPVFLSMDHYKQHGKTSCKEHCIRVSYLSYRICRKMDWNYRSAARAGLLHDLFLYDWHTHARETGNYFHGLTHPKVAARNAALHFSLTDQEQNIILRHMWPLTLIPPDSKEGFSIVYADKYCSLAEVTGNLAHRILDKTGVKHDVLGKITEQ